MARVVVIGAGMGGLAAAARLAATGHEVTVCEQSSEIGGKLGWYERDGFGFDTGPSLLTMPGVFEDLFAATGGPLRDAVALRRLDPIATYRFADGTTLAAHADDDAFTAELDACLGGGAGADWRRLAARAARVFDAAEGPFLSSPVRPAGLARLAWASPGDIGAVAPGRSLRHLGTGLLRDPRLRQLLDRYATYSGSDPRRAPAALVSVVHAERHFGAWYVPGGLRRLGQAVAERAAGHGARFLLDTRVLTVTRTPGGRVDGVRLADGVLLPADVVVADVDAASLYGRLVDDPAGRRAVRRATRSMSGFVLLLALSGRTPGLGHHTVTFPADYDAEFDTVFGGRLAPDPAIYVSAPDDPACAPPGDEAWFVLVNAAPHVPSGPDPSDQADPSALADPDDLAGWSNLANLASQAARRRGGGPAAWVDRFGEFGRYRGNKRSRGTQRSRGDGRAVVARGLDWDRPGLADGYARHLLDLLAARGFDVRPRLRWYETITPADLERRTGSVGGAIYGSSSNGARAAFLRPPNTTRVPGLFHIGGSAHPGGGLPLVVLSAAIAADLIGPA
ncbi:Phytoene desaturase [Frankia canadensis]|uniref:Phytoene desaturase n=1 Tax=Frankia canadensis TaxID=1836972 RepID=A0A2I2KMT5_9ACTN|nr:phytoene desaturase family protein [Frankia canadensis]SNQ46973.1 Phytoene desaturase [Frankia canadensis]SOU54263.1 Phytoene desaturase [Frankia canadensis]